ncbi:MAG: PAS domain S-box protein [Planctomycetota bacterium]|nr:PAS domain S-box protein [Planctomycetota bacterium]
MPGMDGFEVAGLIRQRSTTTPIIFVTSFDSAEADLQRGYLLGAVDYLLMPFVPDILRAKVAVFVGLFRQRRELASARDELCTLNERLEEKVRERSAALTAEITERKRAAAAIQQLNASLGRRVRERTAELEQATSWLRQSEEKYRALVEATATGFLILDAHGKVREANDEYVRLTGHDTFAEIAGRSVMEWSAPHDLERNAAEVKQCAKRGWVRSLELDDVNPRGEITPIEPLNRSWNLFSLGGEERTRWLTWQRVP